MAILSAARFKCEASYGPARLTLYVDTSTRPFMAGNNRDYLRRLEMDGRHDLLKKIETGSISVYAAAKLMGYRKGRTAKSRSQQIAYHWTRASEAEKRRFLSENWESVGPIVGGMIKQSRAKSKAQKPSE